MPHLTLGDRGCAPLTALRAAEAAVRTSLPVRARIAEALLLAGAPEPDAWGVVRRLPLAPAGLRATRDPTMLGP